MRRAQGYATITEPARRLVEYDTAQCGHCQRILFTKPGTASTIYLIPLGTPGQFRLEPGAFCRVCMRPVCLPCHADGRCTPWERRLELAERAR